jgi:hypothetical protein
MDGHPVPAEDLAGYLHAFVHELTFSDDDPADVIDRYHAPGFEQINERIVLDRAKLAAHAKPARKNVVACELDVHETLRDGVLVAARYTLHADMRAGARLSNEIFMIGTLAPDGRLSRIVSTSRQLN